MASSPLFGPAKRAAPAAPAEKPWTVIIADDEPSVHDVTVLALDGFQFEGRALKLVHAYSGTEAIERLTEHPEAAAILLDVVMESEHAGLEVARAIREKLENRAIRVVLRTGQPGAAPETEVISKYDINDYKEKSELTARRLYTVMFACLRAYRDITALERTKRGLEKVIDASPRIFMLTNLERFAKGALEQLSTLLRGDEGGVYGLGERDGVAVGSDETGAYRVIAATGRFEGSEGKALEDVLPAQVAAAIHQHSYETVGNSRLLEVYPYPDGRERVLYLEGAQPLNATDKHLVTIFTRNLGIAFDNLRLKEEIEETQREIVYRLGEAVETRSQETGQHVKRVAAGCALIGQRYGLSSDAVDTLRYASPLHDLGKVGIPDRILNKPGPLDAEEWEIMKQHAAIGHRMLADAHQPILQAAATIALEHHEKWDGSGYPLGKRGEDIHLYGRICAAVDVFDALGSRRPYKTTWELPKILGYFREQSGKHFDPKIVELVLGCVDELVAIRDLYPDTP